MQVEVKAGKRFKCKWRGIGQHGEGVGALAVLEGVGKGICMHVRMQVYDYADMQHTCFRHDGLKHVFAKK